MLTRPTLHLPGPLERTVSTRIGSLNNGPNSSWPSSISTSIDIAALDECFPSVRCGNRGKRRRELQLGDTFKSEAGFANSSDGCAQVKMRRERYQSGCVSCDTPEPHKKPMLFDSAHGVVAANLLVTSDRSDRFLQTGAGAIPQDEYPRSGSSRPASAAPPRWSGCPVLISMVKWDSPPSLDGKRC